MRNREREGDINGFVCCFFFYFLFSTFAWLCMNMRDFLVVGLSEYLESGVAKLYFRERDRERERFSDFEEEGEKKVGFAILCFSLSVNMRGC